MDRDGLGQLLGVLLPAPFDEMERTCTAERAAYARVDSLGKIATKTGIPHTSLHRDLNSADEP